MMSLAFAFVQNLLYFLSRRKNQKTLIYLIMH